jgi:hypothetical protein
LPVFVAQLPPDSHCAIASQLTVSALAVAVDSPIATAAMAPAIAAKKIILRMLFPDP